jgi:hypothetical protein
VSRSRVHRFTPIAAPTGPGVVWVCVWADRLDHRKWLETRRGHFHQVWRDGAGNWVAPFITPHPVVFTVDGGALVIGGSPQEVAA